MRYDAILLDVDGTLVDSNEAHARAWSRAATTFGFERDPEFFRPLVGMGGDRILPKIDPSLNLDGEPGKLIGAERKRLVLEEYAPAFRATPGARAFVETCRERGLKTVIATSASAEELQLVLKVTNLENLFDFIVTDDDAEHAKPAPDIVSAALKKCGAEAKRTVMLGDTAYDIEAAHNAQVAALAVRSGGWGDQDLKGALEIFDDPADARRCMDTWLADPAGTLA